jgi:hypothetical protein
MQKHKSGILKELARLERIGWVTEESAGTIFPYVIIEAINLLKNSEIIESPIDYTKTGRLAQKMLDDLSQPH